MATLGISTLSQQKFVAESADARLVTWYTPRRTTFMSATSGLVQVLFPKFSAGSMDRRSKAALLSESHYFQFKFSTNDSAFLTKVSQTFITTRKGNTTRYQLQEESTEEFHTLLCPIPHLFRIDKHLDKLRNWQESFRTEPCRSFRFPSG